MTGCKTRYSFSSVDGFCRDSTAFLNAWWFLLRVFFPVHVLGLYTISLAPNVVGQYIKVFFVCKIIALHLKGQKDCTI